VRSVEEAQVGGEKRTEGISCSREVTDPFKREGSVKTASILPTEREAMSRKERGVSAKGPAADTSGQEVP
jgi:hypothetical protein